MPNLCAKGRTHISIVALHVAAVAVFVPIGSLQAFLEIVPGQAAVQAETCWAAVLQMVSSCTQTARGGFLWGNKNRIVLSDRVPIGPCGSAAGWALAAIRTQQHSLVTHNSTHGVTNATCSQQVWGQTCTSASQFPQWVSVLPPGGRMRCGHSECPRGLQPQGHGVLWTLLWGC